MKQPQDNGQINAIHVLDINEAKETAYASLSNIIAISSIISIFSAFILAEEIKLLTPTILLACTYSAIIYTTYIFWKISKEPALSVLGTLLTLFLASKITGGNLIIVAPAFAIVYLLAANMIRKAQLKEAIKWFENIPLITLTVLYPYASRTQSVQYDIYRQIAQDTISQDTLYHASIAAAIKNYGLVTTGVNGAAEITYHYLSHQIAASISELTGLSTLTIYSNINYSLFTPVLVASIAIFLIETTNENNPINKSIINLTAIAVVMATIMPMIFRNWLFFDALTHSESFILSLSLFIVALPAAIKPKTIKTSVKDHVEYALMILTITLSKVSTGAAFLLPTLYISQDYRSKEAKKNTIACIIIAASTFFVAYKFINRGITSGESYESFGFLPLHFLLWSDGAEYIRDAGEALLEEQLPSIKSVIYGFKTLMVTFFMHFIMPFITLILMLKVKVFSDVDMNKNAYTTLFITTLLGIICFLFMRAPGGAVFYFSSIPTYVSIVYITSILGNSYITSRNNQLRRTLQLAVLSTGIIVGLTCIPNIINTHRTTNKNYSNAKADLIITKLINIQKDKTTLGSIIVNNVPLSQSTSFISRCSARPLLFTATSERIWTGLLNKYDKCEYENFGYGSFTDLPPLIPARLSTKISMDNKYQLNRSSK